MSKNRPTDPPARQFLGEGQIDKLGTAVLVLARELWVVKDRLAVMEKVLDKHGIPASEFSAFQPDEAFEGELKAQRQQLIDAVVNALSGQTEK